MKLWNIALLAILATWAALATWRLETMPQGVATWHDAMSNCPMYRAEGTG